MATTSADLYDDGHDWTQFSAAERESFFAAIARHRRMSWRVTAVSGLAIAIATLVVGVLTAPLFYAVIGIVFDLVNIIVPAPNVLGVSSTSSMRFKPTRSRRPPGSASAFSPWHPASSG